MCPICLVTKVFEGLKDFCEAYLDDVMVFSKPWQNHITHLEQVFDSKSHTESKKDANLLMLNLSFLAIASTLYNDNNRKLMRCCNFQLRRVRNKYNPCLVLLGLSASSYLTLQFLLSD